MSEAAATSLLAIAFIALPTMALAHGYAGDRYFPPTIAVDDPFAADEAHAVAGKTPRLSAPTSKRSAVYSAGVGVEPIDGWGISVDTSYRSPNPDLAAVGTGFDNLALTVKKELVINPAHEYAVSAGMTVLAGGTGSTGASSHSTYAPAVFYAKGFGDLPHSLLRPFALTGVIAYEKPMENLRPAMLNWGFTVQYSLLYLQSHVGEFGLTPPFSRLVLVVEFPVKTCLNLGCAGQTSGSFNPGVVWVGKGFNVALEAVQPINSRSGHGTGMMLQFQKFFSRQ